MRATTSSVKSKTPKASHQTGIKDFALKPKNLNGQVLSTARPILKTHGDENQVYEFSKGELESKLQEFAQLVYKNKTLQKSTVSSCLAELKTTFFNLFKGDRNEKALKIKKGSTEKVNQEFAFMFKEAELQRKINHLTEDKSICEEKIESHAAYIVDLEKKVDRLINEYEKTMQLNQSLMSELHSSKHDTSLWSNSDIKDRSNSEIVNEMDSLRQSNYHLQYQIKNANHSIFKLEDLLKRVNSCEEQTIKQGIHDLRNQSTTSTKHTPFEQRTLQIVTESREMTRTSPYFAQFHTEEENLKDQLQTEIADYQDQIDQLTSTIDKNKEELDSAKNKCVMLEDELLNRCNLEKAHHEKIKTLEAQIASLLEENTTLKSLKDENSALIQSLKIQVKEQTQPSSGPEDSKDQSMDSIIDLGFLCPKDYVPSFKSKGPKESDETLEKALKNKEKELEDEKINHKIQIEKYSLSMTTLSGKVQILVKINENLTGDIEYMKHDSTNYRTIIWSIYQELKKRIESYKTQDNQIHKYFESAPKNNIVEHLEFLMNSYHQLRREVELIDYLLEERRPFI